MVTVPETVKTGELTRFPPVDAGITGIRIQIMIFKNHEDDYRYS
jgi:hypothetical protein